MNKISQKKNVSLIYFKHTKLIILSSLGLEHQ